VIASTDIAPKKNAKDLAASIGWIALVLATLYVCYFSHLGALGFVGPDEPRYAWIARDMAETGDWVTPRLYGKPWFEKPPLYYWGAAICFKLFGVSEAAARLPSAISALLATLTLAWLAWRIYGAETARWLLLLLATTVGMTGFSHAAATDMPFSATLTIAMVCAAVLLRLPLECAGLPPLSQNEPAPTKSAGALASSATGTLPAIPHLANTSRLAPILFGFFLGLAVLAKGPAAIILCGGAVFFWTLFTKRWRDTLRFFHPAAIATLCATALPWYILCAHRNPDFFRIFIIEHNFKRFLTPEFQHIQPFWFYVPIFLVGVFPWLFWLLGSFRFEPNKDNRIGITPFFLSWVLLPLLFFSASQSKLPGYILPSIPPAIFLVSRFVGNLQRNRPRVALVAAVFTGLLFAGEAAWMLVSLKVAPSHSWPIQFQLPWINLFLHIAAAGFGGLLVIGLAGYGRLQEAQLTAVVTIVLILLHAENSLLPRIDRIVSPRLLAVQIRSSNHLAVYTLGVPRGWRYGLSFYLDREITDLPETISEPALVVVSPKAIHSLEQRAFIEREGSTHWPQAEVVRIRPLAAYSPGGGKAQ
jgi:4-amino-4-deoxy-L-arabinose transferase-like glycosyltransferase